MKKLLASILLLTVVLIGGCAGGSGDITPIYRIITPVVISTPVVIDIPDTTNTPLTESTPVLNQRPPENRTWISPGVVNIGNFHPGARAEWPLTVHNGNEYITERKMVTTELSDTAVVIGLKFLLYGDVKDISFTTDVGYKDHPIITNFDHNTNAIMIEGLASGVTRELDVTYKYYSIYSLAYKFPDRVKEGYSKPSLVVQDWIIIADNTPVLAPFETKEIMIALDMPSNAVFPSDKWAFWISVTDVTQSGMVATEMCSTWLVDMRK